MPDYRTPGVFIEEQPATGPIAGVGTSTAAFIGPALSGPINVPTKFTNWTQFRAGFGEYLVSPRLSSPTPYAVSSTMGEPLPISYASARQFVRSLSSMTGARLIRAKPCG